MEQSVVSWPANIMATQKSESSSSLFMPSVCLGFWNQTTLTKSNTHQNSALVLQASIINGKLYGFRRTGSHDLHGTSSQGRTI